MIGKIERDQPTTLFTNKEKARSGEFFYCQKRKGELAMSNQLTGRFQQWLERFFSCETRWFAAVGQITLAFSIALSSANRNGTMAFFETKTGLPYYVFSFLLFAGAIFMIYWRQKDIGFFIGIIPLLIYIILTVKVSIDHHIYNLSIIYILFFVLIMRQYWREDCNGRVN